MGCVEAQSRLSRLSKQQRTNTNGNEDLQKWTAARCNRLLRQISSRVAHLRQLVAEVTDANRPPKRIAPIDDELPTKKRIRQTYGGRKARPVPLSERDSNTSTPPRIMRVIGAMRPALVSSPAALCCPTPIRPFAQSNDTVSIGAINETKPQKLQTRTREPTLTMTKLSLSSNTVPPEQLKTYQAILTWMSKLLQITEENSLEPGRRSLLGMCMRRIPECVNDIEAWDQQQAEAAGIDSIWGNAEAATTLYSQLESFGGNEEGWKPLKLLARSHAMQVLSEAVAEGLFVTDFVALLSKTCADIGCAQEAAQLLSAYRRSLKNQECEDIRYECDAPNSREMCDQALVDMCTSEALTPSLLPALGDAIHGEDFHIADIAPRHRSTLWRTSMGCLSDAAHAWLGSRLLIPTLESLASGDQNGPWATHESKERTLTSLAAGLTAAAISMPLERDRRRYLHVFETAITQLLTKRGRSRKAEHSGLFLLMMARQLALEAGNGSHLALKAQSLIDLGRLTARSDVQTMYRQTAALCCSIAHACSRSEGTPSQKVLDELRTALQEMPLPKWFAESLRSDGAFLLAHKTKDLRDLQFAENLPETAGQTPSRAPTMFSGWRWEASISEWVKPSPLAKSTVKHLSDLTAPRENDRHDLERSTKNRMQRESLLNNKQARHGTRSIDAPKPTNRTEDNPRLLLVVPHETLAGTMKAAPRRRTTPVMHTDDTGLGPVKMRRRDSESQATSETVGSPVCVRSKYRDEGFQGYGSDVERPRRLGKTRALALDVAKKPSSSSLENSSRVRNENGVEDGAQGCKFMRLAASSTAYKGRRHSSTMAEPRALGKAGQRSRRIETGRGQRRTTVSLSSLVSWPGSDDWDELL
ncbi:hypothetical protein LIA77_10071 [Sarocladium implicatum]|nr:hypothetical protein LIA77_10071 [Sarocladium implicatum]